MKNKNEENKVKRDGLKKKINRKSLMNAMLTIVSASLVVAPAAISAKNNISKSQSNYLEMNLSDDLNGQTIDYDKTSAEEEELTVKMQADFEKLCHAELDKCYQFTDDSKSKKRYNFNDFDVEKLMFMWLSRYVPFSKISNEEMAYFFEKRDIVEMILTYGSSYIQEDDDTNRNHSEFFRYFWNDDWNYGSSIRDDRDILNGAECTIHRTICSFKIRKNHFNQDYLDAEEVFNRTYRKDENSKSSHGGFLKVSPLYRAYPSRVTKAMRDDFDKLFCKELSKCQRVNGNKIEYDFSFFDRKQLVFEWLSPYVSTLELKYYHDKYYDEYYDEYYIDELYLAEMMVVFGYPYIQESDNTNRNHIAFYEYFYGPTPENIEEKVASMKGGADSSFSRTIHNFGIGENNVFCDVSYSERNQLKRKK